MPFEDELGEALRHAGDGFSADGLDLVAAGERRGRRMVVRRRAAVAGGSALALAVIGTVGVYTGGLFGPGGGGPAVVAAAPEPPVPTPAPSTDGEGRGGPRVGSGAVSAEQLIEVFKELLPQGKLTLATARGTDDELGPMVSGVFDDGKGKGAIGLSLNRTDPKGRGADGMVTCPSKTTVNYENCVSETLADGSRLMLFQGYEYSDRRVDTKRWRATVVTPQGFLLDAQEHNAPTEKGSATTRPTPPLTLDQLRALVTSPLWHPALDDLPSAPTEPPAEPVRSGTEALDILGELVAGYGIPVVGKDDDGADLGYVVLDEGKGKSLVSLQIQPDNPGHPGTWADLFTTADTLPDGSKLLTRKQPGEKGGAGVVWWSVEVLRPNGTRLIVSAFNSPTQSAAATRKLPALTMEQLQEIATSPKWPGFGQ
ncbi:MULTISPECIES: hypothetical protein [unclassified Streptomyces]|uniref:hypothetical protein n=1 Tax=unclassified Streptomyces TaxID=2593676 RepID=UPI000DC79AE1|nr:MULTISPECIES: hypothetical protein [unclassified Streptomyces]AWZ09795.1 hypothetical protein DRB89_41370 [Streptomyces sp. ICC4]AWZ17576.1 hypothetical protein DRB96_42155 [Streptomyces sp. ICC1]